MASPEADVGSNRWLFDFLSALLLFITAILGAYVPRYLSFKDGLQVGDGRSVVFHLGNMLSAGVMLSAGFCHLMADALRHVTYTGRFPLVPFLAATGYIITLLADQIVQHVTEESYDADKDEDADAVVADAHNTSAPHRTVVMNGGLAAIGSMDDSGGGGVNKAKAKQGPDAFLTDLHHREHGGGKQQNPTAAPPASLHSDPFGDSERRPLTSSASVGSPVAVAAAAIASGNLAHSYSGHSSQPLPEMHDHHAHVKVFLAHKPLSFGTTVLLACALCIHSILEGVALGSQRTMKDTEDIMIAIAAHKGLAAYALGASIVESKASAPRFWTIVGLFSSATPIGILVGYGFSEMGSGGAGAALSALASGTFLYVAMMEVIPKELQDPKHRLLKMVMLLLGFGLMSLLAVWA